MLTEPVSIRETDIRQILYYGTKDFLLGSLPVTSFLDAFLPNSGATPHTIYIALGSEPTSKDLTKVLGQLELTTLKFDDSHTRSNNQDFVVEGLRPDIVVYGRDCNERGSNFGLMEFWLELKSGEDIFDVADQFLPDNTDAGVNVVGQLLSYAVAQLTSGFWTHCFSVVVFSNGARLIRWDRAGAVISERFSVTGDHNPLFEFCRRFDSLTPAQRGRDMSIRSPIPEERHLAFVALSPQGEGDNVPIFDVQEESLVEYLVDDVLTGRMRRFIGPSPRRQVLSLRGRSTRGCPVYDTETKQVCYLKDTWRIDCKDSMEEGDVYAVLERAKVENIPKVVAHGTVMFSGKNESCIGRSAVHNNCATPSGSANLDVQVNGDMAHQGIPQSTQTDKFCGKYGLKGRVLQGLVHYRIVVDVVGHDLTGFRSSKEVLQVFIDILTAHGQAYSKAGILHRDISLGNIVITPDRRGLLIDWDSARPVCTKPSRPIDRAGTWRFMSGILLNDPLFKSHEYADDLESAVHVMLYLFLLYSESNWSSVRVRNYAEDMFDAFLDDRLEDGSVVRFGGEKKVNLLTSGTYPSAALLFIGRPGLSYALRQVSRVFKCVYRLLHLDGLRRRAEMERKQEAELGIESIYESSSESEEASEKSRLLHEEIRKLNTYEGGGTRIVKILTHTLKLASGWQDDRPAERVELPVPSNWFLEVSNESDEEEKPRRRKYLHDGDSSAEDVPERVKAINPSDPQSPHALKRLKPSID